jgi:hypothetical protein
MRSLVILFMLIFNSYGFQIDNKSILEGFIKSEISGQPTFYDIKCGTRYDLAVESHKDKIDPGLYENYIQFKKSEPIRQRSVVTPAGFFQLHWDDTGSHTVPQEDLSGNGYPDYIDSAAVILDHVWNIQVEQMGYLPPPGEDGNPAIPYQIYFTNHFNYGVTWKGDLVEANLPDTSFTSYIEIDNDFSEDYFPTKGLDGLKVTAAHEFHHAIQFGYNFRDDDVYFFEMTSTWMEEYLYPEIDDYLNYLDYFFKVVSNTRFDFNSNTLYPYANSIYLQMLEEQHDASIIRSVWEKIRTEKSLSALISTLEENNSTWFESLGEYGLWLYYTGDRAISGKYFTDALFFPEVSIKSEDIIEFDAAYVDDVTIGEIANRYLEFQKVRGKIIDIQVIANDNLESGFRLMTPHSNSDLYPVNTQITSDPIDSDQMVLVITNAELNEISTIVDIVLNDSIDLTTVSQGPNPVNTKYVERVRFRNVPPDAELHIFNVAGKRIARVENKGTSRGDRFWDLKNDDGHKVAGGIYMFLVQGDGLLKTGKFSIIR